MIQGKITEVENIFDAQKPGEKNIFIAIMTVFKWNFIWSFVGNGIHVVAHMAFPIIIGKIVTFMDDKDNHDFSYGISLMMVLGLINSFLMLINCHTWYNNITTGCLSQKILTAMTVKKQLRLNTATSKNYEAGQIHSVRGATHRFVWFCYEASGFMTTPLWITYCVIRLF